MNPLRRKFLVDRRVQGALAWRVVIYWAISLWGIFCVLAAVPIVLSVWFGFENGPTLGELLARTWRGYWPSLAASLLILPGIVWDVIRLSHRFAGPMIRFRRAMRDLADGKPVAPLKFRDGDFWSDLASDFNDLAERVQSRAENCDASASDGLETSTCGDRSVAHAGCGPTV